MSYTTLAAVKLHMGITGADQDGLLTALIDEVKPVIDDYCHTTFEVTADSTRRFDPTCDVEGRTLWLDAWLCAVTTVTNGDGVVVAATEYVTEPRNGTPWFALTLKSNSNLSWTYNGAHEDAIAAHGKWGYSATVPPAVSGVANRLVELSYNSQGNTGMSKMDVEDLSVTFSGAEAQANILSDLDSYRRRV